MINTSPDDLTINHPDGTPMVSYRHPTGFVLELSKSEAIVRFAGHNKDLAEYLDGFDDAELAQWLGETMVSASAECQQMLPAAVVARILAKVDAELGRPRRSRSSR
jgi:hypothetical protein